MLLLEGEGLLATGSDDGSVRWWNPETGRCAAGEGIHGGRAWTSHSPPSRAPSSVSRRHHTNTVSCMCLVERDGLPFLATGSFDGCAGPVPHCLPPLLLQRARVTRPLPAPRTVVVWDLAQQRALQPRAESHFEAHRGEEAEVLAMAYLAPREVGGWDSGSASPPASRAASRSPVPAGPGARGESPSAASRQRGQSSPRGAARRAYLLTGGNDRVIRVRGGGFVAGGAPSLPAA